MEYIFFSFMFGRQFLLQLEEYFQTLSSWLSDDKWIQANFDRRLQTLLDLAIELETIQIAINSPLNDPKLEKLDSYVDIDNHY